MININSNSTSSQHAVFFRPRLPFRERSGNVHVMVLLEKNTNCSSSGEKEKVHIFFV